jgi:4a-hydroxytetrahydrobiopterin dehydratase
MKLIEQTCKPILAATLPLTGSEAKPLSNEVPEWTLGEKELIREFRFRDFHEAMDFVNAAAGIANDQDHHPDIAISYNKVRLTLSTHKIGGLSLNDFIVAAKVDLIAERFSH